MDLHEELQRRARLASADAAARLGAASVGDALVALVGRRRRRQAAVVTGTSAACVAALVGGAMYIGHWGVGMASPAGVTSGATVIDVSTPLAPATLSWAALVGDNVPAVCGDAYTATPGATRHVDDPTRWPVTVTASASLSRGSDGVLTVGKDFLNWNVSLAPEAAAKDLSVVVFDVVERDGVVVGVGNRGLYDATSRTPIAFEALLPGSCGYADVPPLAGDGAYTFHLWAQVVDAGHRPVATVIDPGGPVTLKVEGLTEYWNGPQSLERLPRLSLEAIQCGDLSSVEGRAWESGSSASLPEGAVMPGWQASRTDGPAPGIRASLGAPLLPNSVAAAQAFGVVDGVVVAVGPVRYSSDALSYSASFDLSAPCGPDAHASMDMFVLEEALVGDGTDAQVAAAVVFRLGPVAVVPTVATIGAVAPPVISLVDAALSCGDEWTAEPSIVLHSDNAAEGVTGVFLEPSEAGGGWDVTLATADNVAPDTLWLAGAYLVADGKVVGVSEVQHFTAYGLDGATIPEASPAACSTRAGSEVTQHVVVQAVTRQGPEGRSAPIATWVDPFGK